LVAGDVPLGLLVGVFYSARTLAEPWQAVSKTVIRR
jgi:hypothetical protein